MMMMVMIIIMMMIIMMMIIMMMTMINIIKHKQKNIKRLIMVRTKTSVIKIRTLTFISEGKNDLFSLLHLLISL
jgi:hypothetical protein